MASVYSRCKKLISSNTRSQKCHCVRTELRRANDLIDHVRKLETDVSALEAKVSDKAVQHAERFHLQRATPDLQQYCTNYNTLKMSFLACGKALVMLLEARRLPPRPTGWLEKPAVVYGVTKMTAR